MRKDNERNIKLNSEGVLFIVYDRKQKTILLEARLKDRISEFGKVTIPGETTKVIDNRKETPEETLSRGTREELGISPNKPTHLLRIEGQTDRLVYRYDAFLVTNYEGQVSNEEPEESAIFWTGLDEASAYLKHDINLGMLKVAKQQLQGR